MWATVPNSDLNDLVNSNASFHKLVLNFGQEILSRLQTQSNYTSSRHRTLLKYPTSKTSPYKYLFSVILLLSNDINLNPGPQKDPCCECLKGCRRNQKAIQCDECQGWFHAKCINMSSIEYNYHLQDTDSNWSCNSCLFPGLMADSSTQLTSRSATTISVDANGALNPNLKKRGMKFGHLNVASLHSHCADVDVVLKKTNIDVMAFSESRLDSTIADSLICPSNYVCYRKDRNRQGGGCTVFVKNKWPSKRRDDLESSCLEMVCVEICPEKARNTLFITTYKPPIMDSDKFVTRFQDVLMKLENETIKDIIITGDFNADVGALKLNKYTRKLMQITRLHGLTQLIKNPTRVTEDTSSTIDLIFVNNCHRIVTHGVQECGISDHSIVYCHMNNLQILYFVDI